MLHYLFGFSGRINRAKMWLFLLIFVIYICICVAAIFSVVGMDTLMAVGQHKLDQSVIATKLAAGGAVLGLLGLVYLLLLFCGLAIITKRLHDRDRSAWWLLLFVFTPLVLNVVRLHMMGGPMQTDPMQAMHNPVILVLGLASLIIQIWAFIELYVLRGTVGENRFGPDPLA
jgi:uncharacterized membrane protein YhaH (DUF805 family)